MVFVHVGSSGAHLSASKGPALAPRRSVAIAVAIESEVKLNISDDDEASKIKILASNMCQKKIGIAGTTFEMKENRLWGWAETIYTFFALRNDGNEGTVFTETNTVFICASDQNNYAKLSM